MHELAHLRVRTHGEEFLALLDSLQPDWQERRRLLNDLPILDR
ncbi:MAG: M48 family metallopeptidase [Synechococcaceae cyanobacterium]